MLILCLRLHACQVCVIFICLSTHSFACTLFTHIQCMLPRATAKSGGFQISAVRKRAYFVLALACMSGVYFAYNKSLTPFCVSLMRKLPTVPLLSGGYYFAYVHIHSHAHFSHIYKVSAATGHSKIRRLSAQCCEKIPTCVLHMIQYTCLLMHTFTHAIAAICACPCVHVRCVHTYTQVRAYAHITCITNIHMYTRTYASNCAPMHKYACIM